MIKSNMDWHAFPTEMQLEAIVENWNRSGVVILPDFFQRPEIAELRQICDHILKQALAKTPDLANASNIAYLTERFRLFC